MEVDPDGVSWYRYRGKGATNGHRELPRPAFDAILDALKRRGLDFETLTPDARLFDLSVHGYYLALQRAFRRAGLDVSGVHVLRHSYARMLRELGESIEDVSNALDHRSIATTATYLKRLEGQRDSRWRKTSRALGIA